jgi:hypothetical protein
MTKLESFRSNQTREKRDSQPFRVHSRISAPAVPLSQINLQIFDSKYWFTGAKTLAGAKSTLPAASRTLTFKFNLICCSLPVPTTIQLLLRPAPEPTWYTDASSPKTPKRWREHSQLTYGRHWEYASIIWSPYRAGEVKRFESVERTFNKRVAGLASKSYDSRLKLLGIDSLETRRLKQDLLYTYKILFGAVNTWTILKCLNLTILYLCVATVTNSLYKDTGYRH